MSQGSQLLLRNCQESSSKLDVSQIQTLANIQIDL